MLIAAIVLAPVLAAALLAVAARSGARIAALVAAGGCALSAGAALALLPSALLVPETLTVPWAAPLGPDLALRADAWGLILASLVGIVGLCITIYAAGYLHGAPDLPRLFATLLVFAAAMQLIALGDDPWLVFIGWELTSVCSYLLVLHTRRPEALRAATTALLVTGLGGLSLLGGLVIVQQITGIERLSELPTARDHLLAHPWMPAALIAIVIGCATKSALFPFHFWLPGAMAAPTPISAYLHAATMVKAGIFLLARLHPAFGGTALWEALLGGLGALTVLAAARRLPSTDDLKQLLAWSTVLALGTLAVLLSLDGAAAMLAVVLLLLAHAAYKGTLFLVVGAIDHGTGTRLLPRLGGLARAMPWTAASGMLGAASMMGLPPFAGFVAKEQVKLAEAGWLASSTLFLSALALVAVAWWVGIRPFWHRAAEPPLAEQAHEGGLALLVPTLALAILGLLFGVAGAWIVAPLAARAAADLAGSAIDAGLPILPSTALQAASGFAVIACGILLAEQRERLARWLSLLPNGLSARLWDHALHAALAAGRAVVHVTQHGDLRGYLGVALLSGVALAGFGLADIAWTLPVSQIPLWMWPIAVLLVAGALMAAAARTRLAAIAGLGAVGYGIALLFVSHGAPDLAFTQVVVETLTVVLFVLAFRHLPELRAHALLERRRAVNAVIAVASGAAATALALAAETGTVPHLGDRLIAAAWERGHGANAVNVILVDIRALDTFGEITVLLLAAIGVSALVTAGSAPRPLLARSPILSAASRLILPLATLFALWLWWRGHHQPGGGFIAGLCVAAGVVLVAAARGGIAARRALLAPPLAIAASGLALAWLAGAVGLIAGGSFLFPHWLGPFGTPLLFDLGVLVLVLGVVVLTVEQMLIAEEGGT
ncbi:MAG: proton-conducting transporter membrane subunit [Planctomycetota bacterium]|nr:proton-conducting transporter membrane subunit [Planctomycetota bacterium]